MAKEVHVPPACAFALAVLQEQASDPAEVPEEAVEAAREHLATCLRCLGEPPIGAPGRRKRRARKPVGAAISAPEGAAVDQASPSTGKTAEPERLSILPTTSVALLQRERSFDCEDCQSLLPDYAAALEHADNVAHLYPQVHAHLSICTSDCPVLLDLLLQESQADRAASRPVRNPLAVIGWELSGFFRSGQVAISPLALACGTLILLLLVASLSTLLAIRWDDARFASSVRPQQSLPTPDGVGLSDGLHIYDACNPAGYQTKRQAARALQASNTQLATRLLTQATAAATTDTSGCNGAEAAIYRADLQVRQSDHPSGMLVIAFDSGPGNADPTGGTDRHLLYAAATQELIGSSLAQAQFNSGQLHTPGAPLLYLVLANTAGTVQGALQIAQILATMPHAAPPGLLATGQIPLLGVVGLTPGNLLQAALPVLCQAGVPVLSPTATSLSLIKQLTTTSLYQHCPAGFALARLTSDDTAQSAAAASYAYTRLGARNVAVFSDPGNVSSQEMAQSFLTAFRQKPQSRVVAEETAVSADLPASSPADTSATILLAGLNDALQAHPRPDLIFAPLLTNDLLTLVQAIAKLPASLQPAVLSGGELVHPRALQALVPWARQQQLTLPYLALVLATAARPPVSPWQKQFYAGFCNVFANPGSSCSGAAALDPGALLFADSVELVGLALGPTALSGGFPGAAQLVQRLRTQHFAGVSGQVTLQLIDQSLLLNQSSTPVLLGLQGDGSLQIIG